MDKIWWREYRRALGICAAVTGWLIASVASGYALAKIEHVPPAVAVTPAPSGSGNLGRAPVVQPLEQTAPPTVKRTPQTWVPEKPRHAYRSPRSVPSPSPSSGPTPKASGTPVSATPEPSMPDVSPTP